MIQLRVCLTHFLLIFISASYCIGFSVLFYKTPKLGAH